MFNITDNTKLISPILTALVLACALVVISRAMILGISIGVAVACIPLLLLLALISIKKPFWSFLVLFVVNYFVITLIRYNNTSGLSIIIDTLLIFIVISAIINYTLTNSIHESPKLINPLTIVSALWAIYCILELVNPSALPEAWFVSRGVAVYLFLMSIVTVLSFREYKHINSIVMLLSVLTLMGVAKALMQKFIGFDATEREFLDEGGYRTHLLLSGTRYFSFYVSASIFGAVMGHATVLFGILAIYTKDKVKCLYFIFVAVASFYGLLLSGTRGALAIPIAGFALFLIFSKDVKIIIPTFVSLLAGYVFLAMTYIGQGNQLIRRMRTLFNPNEPSLIVRKENQKLFAEYLADKPFGEGLGLSGVDVQNISERFTTSIPTDSWYVKIWVETGVVGLTLHIAMLVFIIAYGSYIILFKIKNYHLKGVLSAFICSTFGILISSYGNQVLGQFPIVLITYMSMALVFMGPYFDKQIAKANGTLLLNE